MVLECSLGHQRIGRKYPLFQALRDRTLGNRCDLSLLARSVPEFFCEDSSLCFGSKDGDESCGGDWGPLFALRFANRLDHTGDGGNLLATAGETGYVRIVSPFDAQGRSESRHEALVSWKAHCNAIFDMNWSEDDTCLVTASGDCRCALWDCETQQSISVFRGHTASVKTCGFLPNSDNNKFISGGRDGMICMWDRREACGGTRLSSWRSPVLGFMNDGRNRSVGDHRNGYYPASSITSIVVLSDYLFVSGEAGTSLMRFWDLRMVGSRNPELTVIDNHDGARHEGNVRSVASWVVRPPGRWHGTAWISTDASRSVLCTSSTDHWVRLHSLASPGSAPKRVGMAPITFFARATISPDARYVAIGGDSTIRCWESSRVDHDMNASISPTVHVHETSHWSFRAHKNDVNVVSWSHTNHLMMASCGDDGTIRVWRPAASSSVSREPLLLTGGLDVVLPCPSDRGLYVSPVSSPTRFLEEIERHHRLGRRRVPRPVLRTVRRSIPIAVDRERESGRSAASLRKKKKKQRTIHYYLRRSPVSSTNPLHMNETTGGGNEKP